MQRVKINHHTKSSAREPSVVLIDNFPLRNVCASIATGAMSMVRRFRGLPTLCVVLAVTFPMVANAEVLHWWRFEEGAFREDSVGGATLALKQAMSNWTKI